jgi:hypothetical protein
VTLEIWRQVVFRLKGVSDEEVRCRRDRHDRQDHRIPFKSAILTDFSSNIGRVSDEAMDVAVSWQAGWF